MNAKAVGITVAVISLAVVGGIVWWESTALTSPGPLHPSHELVPALTARNSCEMCHGDASISVGQACLSCHEPIETQGQTGTGLHGSLESSAFDDCGSCHTEHVGGAVELVSELSFKLSGIDNSRHYEHTHVESYVLTGAHDELACVRCHESAWSASLTEGQHRFIGESQECSTCHDDPHSGELPECETCHGQQRPFNEAPGFDHDMFPLVGGHSIADCRQCHEDESYRNTPTNCRACHAEEYRATQNPPHAAVGFDMDCAQCHGINEWDQTEYAHTDTFPLVGSHDNLTCAHCHTDDPDALETLADASCAICHESSHSAAFASAIPAVMDVPSFKDSCASCHDQMHSTFRRPNATMTNEQHAATGFSLGKPHDTQSCVDCHIEIAYDVQWDVSFPCRNPEDCQACHGDPHLGQFDAGATGGECLKCHVPDRFVPTKFDVQMHASCAFPLTGSHRAIACQACHKSEGEMIRFVPTPSACSDCHEDVHEGRFDTPRFAAIPTEQQGCARCHVTTSFKEVSWTADEHELWTGYALVGAHINISCQSCHSPAGESGAADRFVVPDQACATCHFDVHAGQFEVAGRTDCARCHVETDFRNVRFDHNRDAKFALDEHHATLACISCHAVYDTPDGPVTRYRPLGTQCVDCHGNPDDTK